MSRLLLLAGVLTCAPLALGAQVIPGQKVGGSANMHLVAHVPIRGFLQVGDIDIEQELSRPFVYVSRLRLITNEPGFTVLDIRDPARAHVIYERRLENSELHEMGMGGLGVKYFKLKGRYYLVNGFQFGNEGPNANLGAVIFDVTGLPDTSAIREVGRIRVPEYPNGFHNVFTYKHSDGRVLLFAAFAGMNPAVHVYDMGKFLGKDSSQGLIGTVPLPEGTALVTGSFTGNAPTRLSRGLNGYHDMFVGYDAATHQDRFYGAGAGGFYIYDVTRPEEPKLLTSIVGVAGVSFGHTFTPTPDGRYAVVETEYQGAPLRIFDLKPGLDGQVKSITRPIGAWQADWRDLAHNTEVRWPYVFVTGYEDGLQVMNMMDPTNPYTVGFYYTCGCAHESGWTSNRQAPRGKTIFNGALALDIRNADGLIVMTDWESGFWAFKMDAFDGWNGHQWGVPNLSSAQDWDRGPEGAPKPSI